MEGLKPVEGKQVTVAVGNSGLFLLSTLEKSNTDKSTISIDEVEVSFDHQIAYGRTHTNQLDRISVSTC